MALKSLYDQTQNPTLTRRRGNEPNLSAGVNYAKGNIYYLRTDGVLLSKRIW